MVFGVPVPQRADTIAEASRLRPTIMQRPNLRLSQSTSTMGLDTINGGMYPTSCVGVDRLALMLSECRLF